MGKCKYCGIKDVGTHACDSKDVTINMQKQDIAILRQQVKDLEALKIAHLTGNPLKEIETLRQQVTALETKLAIAIEALEIYSANKKVGLRATLALIRLKESE